MYTCPWHHTQLNGVCPDCAERLENLPDASEMTVDERAGELQDWVDKEILTVPFGDLQQRIEVLVGRPVWTHELVGIDSLIAEIRNQQPATFSDVLDKIPDHVKVIVVEEAP